MNGGFRLAVIQITNEIVSDRHYVADIGIPSGGSHLRAITSVSDAGLCFSVRRRSNLPAFIPPRRFWGRLYPCSAVTVEISNPVVSRSVRRIAEQRSQARPEPSCDLRRGFQVLV